MSEGDIMRRVWKAASRRGITLWRNNVGVAQHQDGSRVVYGLCPGSADLIGFTPIVITDDMVGRTLPVFTAIEVKCPGSYPTEKQENFLRVVRESGGIALVARSEADLKEIPL